MGEFVYDWAWAHAARQMGAGYYPKVVVGVPFTPATGARLLTAPDRPRDPLLKALVGGLHELCRATSCHGVHVLFPTEAEAAALEPLGGATRLPGGWTPLGANSSENGTVVTACGASL